MSTKAVQQLDTKELLRRHQLHRGVYDRIARRLGVNPSYVSRVARGGRESPKILNALVEELRRIEKS
jgi:transcriptional regulator with XRE-family HTH domain